MTARRIRLGVAFGVGGVLVAAVVVGAFGMADPPAAGPSWLMERKSDAFTEAIDRAYWARAWANSIAYSRTPTGSGTFGRVAPQFEKAVELLAESNATTATVLPEDSLVALRKVLVGAVRTADRDRVLRDAPQDWNRQDPGKLMDDGLADLVRQARQALGTGALNEDTTTLILSPPSEPGKWGTPLQ